MSLVPEDYTVEETDIVEEETPEVMPVLVDVSPIEPARPSPLPAIQAAAAAATGFVAGAATMALMKRHAARKLAQTQGPRRGGERWPVAGPGRTFLVHVHVLPRPGE